MEKKYAVTLELTGGDIIQFTKEEDELDHRLIEVSDELAWNFKDNDLIWIGDNDYVPARRVNKVSVNELN